MDYSYLIIIYNIATNHILPTLSAMDQKAMLALNFTGSHFTDQFWYDYSNKLIWIPLILATIYSLLRNQKGTTTQSLLYIVGIVALIFLLDRTSSGIIKPLVGRLRPSHNPAISNLLHYVNGYHGGQHGFVSGHATITAGIATWLWMTYKDKLSRCIFVLFAITIGYSRIYLGVHYPGDVLCGSLLGIAMTWGTFRLVNRKYALKVSRQRPKAILITYGLTILAIVILGMTPISFL